MEENTSEKEILPNMSKGVGVEKNVKDNFRKVEFYDENKYNSKSTN